MRIVEEVEAELFAGRSRKILDLTAAGSMEELIVSGSFILLFLKVMVFIPVVPAFEA